MHGRLCIVDAKTKTIPQVITELNIVKMDKTLGKFWTEVKENEEIENEVLLPESVDARYVKLVITKGEQGSGNVARIVEFQVGNME